MTKFLATIICALALINDAFSKGSPGAQTSTASGFIENKGQMHDQHYHARPDVLFGGSDGRMSFHLTNNGISYQLFHAREAKPVPERAVPDASMLPRCDIARVDVRWLNVLSDVTIKTSNPLSGCTHYYNGMKPEGVLNVKTYKDVVYRNIYRGIDLKWKMHAGALKYDFIVAPGADYTQIVMQIKGAAKVFVNASGELVMETPLGSITEGAPLVTQHGRTLPAKWTVNGNEAGYVIGGVDPGAELIIDPAVLAWGTYYGGSDNEYVYGTATDASANVFITGMTQSYMTNAVIATSGAFQLLYQGNLDGFMAKFNAAGVRQWGTYYGGQGQDQMYGAATDANGNSYFAGYTTNSTGLTTSGAHKQVNNAPSSSHQDALLVKFDPNGVRIWGTLYGDDQGGELGYDCATDASGNIFMVGQGSYHTGTSVATPGAFQTTVGGATDIFIVKFNAAGVRQWGTAYGSVANEYVTECAVDPSGDLLITGYSISNSPDTYLATANAHQSANAGSADAFVTKFSSSGARLWSTYLGGVNYDSAEGCCTDGNGNVYVCGATNNVTGTSVATPGSHQQTVSVFGSAFLVKFTPAGTRLWGTLYGEGGHGECCVTDAANNVFLMGRTSSTTGIATPGAHQMTVNALDGYLAKFDPSGVRQWGTYFGGAAFEWPRSCAIDPFGAIYAGGNTTSAGSGIATSTGHQPSHGSLGYEDGFLMKFLDCAAVPAPPQNTTPVANLQVCAGKGTTLTASGSGTVSWYSAQSGGNAVHTGSSYALTLPAGIHTRYAEVLDCMPSASRTAFTFTVHPLPVVSVPAANVCLGTTATLTPTGASIYSWNTGATGALTVTPSTAQSFTVTGTSTVTGCSNTFAVNVTTLALPPVSLTAPSTPVCAGDEIMLNAGGGDVYAWSGGESGPTVTVAPALTTVYGVTATSNSTGCSNVKSVTINVDPCTSLGKNSINNAQVFPNPFSAEISIRFSDDKEHEVAVYNALGELIHHSNVRHKATIDLSQHAPGIYFFHSEGSSKILVRE